MSSNKALTPISQFRHDLDLMRTQIAAALPKHVDLDKFARVVMTAVQTSPNLLTCERTSLLRACIEAATDGLIPDGREGAIVPYKGRAGWQPMVWGLVKLVRQSGELETIGARIVRDGEDFSHWIDESGEHFKHTPSYSTSDKESPMKLVYAYARTKDGGVYLEVISAAEITKFRNLSKAKSDESPWQTWPDEMAKARAIKRLCKRLPLSVDAIEALERDNRREAEELGTAGKSNVIDMLNRDIVQSEPTPAQVEHERQPEPSAELQLEPPPPAIDPALVEQLDDAVSSKLADWIAAISSAQDAETANAMYVRASAWAVSTKNDKVAVTLRDEHAKASAKLKAQKANG